MEQTLKVEIKPYQDYARFKEIINRVNEAAVQKESIEAGVRAGYSPWTGSRCSARKRKSFMFPGASTSRSSSGRVSGVFQREPVRGRIWFAPDGAGYIEGKIRHEDQDIIPQKDGSRLGEQNGPLG